LSKEKTTYSENVKWFTSEVDGRQTGIYSLTSSRSYDPKTRSPGTFNL